MEFTIWRSNAKVDWFEASTPATLWTTWSWLILSMRVTFEGWPSKMVKRLEWQIEDPDWKMKFKGRDGLLMEVTEELAKTLQLQLKLPSARRGRDYCFPVESEEEIDEEDDNWKEASKLKPYPHLRNEKTIEQRWLINFCLFAVLWTSFLVLEKS